MDSGAFPFDPDLLILLSIGAYLILSACLALPIGSRHHSTFYLGTFYQHTLPFLRLPSTLPPTTYYLPSTTYHLPPTNYLHSTQPRHHTHSKLSSSP